MSATPDPPPSRRRAQTALAAYLRLLAACLEDEADLIDNDPARAEQVLARFRDGVVALSLEDAPLDALMDRLLPTSGDPTGAAMLLAGTPDPTQQPQQAKRRH